MPLVGDTVRFSASFYNFGDTLADQDTVVVQMYDGAKEELGPPITLDASAKDSTGKYHYDYTIPTGHKKLYCEFTGTLNNLPSVERVRVDVVWIE